MPPPLGPGSQVATEKALVKSPKPHLFSPAPACPEQVPSLPQTFILQAEKLTPSSEQSCTAPSTKPASNSTPEPSRRELDRRGRGCHAPSSSSSPLQLDPAPKEPRHGAGGWQKEQKCSGNHGQQQRARCREAALQTGAEFPFAPNAALQDRRDNSIGGTRAN